MLTVVNISVVCIYLKPLMRQLVQHLINIASLNYGCIVIFHTSCNYWSFMQKSKLIHHVIMHSDTMAKRRAENNGSKYSPI